MKEKDYYFDEDGLKCDPKESDPKYRGIIKAAEREAEEKLKDSPLKDELGFCHLCWNEQKRILKKKYNIDWKTPAEMNPEVLFD